MQPITNNEFLTIVQGLKSLVGSRFQGSFEAQQKFFWTFWTAENGDTIWVLDLSARNPLLLPFSKEGRIPAKDRKKSPTGLFLQAHFVNKHLLDVVWRPELGRVIFLRFTDDHSLEVRLFRGGANILLTTPEKKLSWAKPLELKPLEWRDEGEGRSLAELAAAAASRPGDRLGKTQDPEALREEHLRKLAKSIQKIRQDIEQKSQNSWAEVAKWLKEHQSLDVPGEWVDYVDPAKDLYANIETAYEKSKQLREKSAGAAQRLAQLQDETQRWQAMDGQDILNLLKRPKRPPLKSGKKEKFRGITLASGHQMVIGRSGRENLEILRASSPWDYWLHLRDYPSAHAVLRRNKNESISDQALRSAINAFIRENFRAKVHDQIGESFDVIVAELRFVKPIKGDQLGRVTFSHERVLRHLLT